MNAYKRDLGARRSEAGLEYTNINVIIMAGQAGDYKIIMLGDSGVGKTTFFHRVRTGEFMDTTETVGRLLRTEERLVHRVKIGDVEIKAYLYDTCGEEQFRTFTSNFYRKTDAVILMYSVEDDYTFDNLKLWIDDATDSIDNDNLVWALVGNKCDLPLYIDHKLIETQCSQLDTNLSYFASAKTGENVLVVLDNVVEEVHRRKNNPKKTRRKKVEEVDTVPMEEDSIRLGEPNPASPMPTDTEKNSPCCS